MNNRQVADLFQTVADMLAIRGDSVHRILAYQRAAESIRALGRDVNRIYEEGALTSIPAIGATLAEKIAEMLTTDDLEFYRRLSVDVPPGLVEMLRVEGLGPKKVKLIYDKLAIIDLHELEVAARQGQLQTLPGMGAKSEVKILAGIEALSRGDDRVLLGVAWPLAKNILAELALIDGVSRTAIAGSLRRMKETIGDIDLLVAAAEAEKVMDRFCDLDQVESVVGRGPTKARVTLLNGLGVDLRVLPQERWGTLLSYFSGSKAHNVRLRELAQRQGLSLNEYAFTGTDGRETLCESELAVYQTLGLPYILPVLRQDRGEIEAALEGRLPNLVQVDDVVADLHTHTTWSDGRQSVLEMAQAARRRGLNVIVIADHSYSLSIANGLTAERLKAQAAEIRAADEVMGPDFRVLQGTEMEIRADGTLDFPDEVLAELDFVTASLHTSLKQPRDQIMRRIMAAIENPHVDMIGHPTGRLMPDRAEADLDMDAVFEAAARTATLLEINANPQRLDLRDAYVRRAVDKGIKLGINTDAHHGDQLDNLQYGVATAQRGWATAGDVVNCWSWDQLQTYLQKKRR